jgi:hypothetical protein
MIDVLLYIQHLVDLVRPYGPLFLALGSVSSFGTFVLAAVTFLRNW